MICKEEYKLKLNEDLKRFGKRPNLIDWFLRNEKYYIFHYIKRLRRIEFYRDSAGVNKLLFWYHWYCYKHLGFKLKMAIYPNTIGPGFRVYHAGGYMHVGPNVKIGKNCTFVSSVVFGNKTEEPDNRPVIVGDDCYFGIGVTVLGSVKIGNNVSIGAHAVVTHDIPDNAIVGGVPAKILKYKL